jgi:hypothetical protein
LLPSSHCSLQPTFPSPQRHAKITLLNVIAPGPGMPPAALIAADVVFGAQKRATVLGSDVSATQAPVAQSAFEAQAPFDVSSTQ